MTPTQHALRMLREDNYLAAVVERWNSHARVRQDLFGIIDILAVRGSECLGVQATDNTNHSHRVKKLKAALTTADWLCPPFRRLEVWSFRVDARGKTVRRVEEITL